MNYKELKPRPKMGESLRNMGYSPRFAMADLIDNSIDASATKVDVVIAGKKNQYDPVTCIDVFDNGTGMSVQCAEEALTMGSDTHKDGKSLGCFGMGLNTAATSLGRRITVITRNHRDKLACLVYDLDVNAKRNKYIVCHRSLTGEEVNTFNRQISETGSGTWVRIDKIDRQPYSNVKAMVASLRGRSTLRLTFRKFLASKICTITVNDRKLQPWGYNHVEGVQEITPAFPFKLKDGTSLGTLQVVSTLGTEQIGGQSRAQGLVVLRNNRDITPNPEWHGTRVHNWELSGVFVIWTVQAEAFDSLMGTTVMKNSWQMPQSVKDSLTREISADLTTYMKKRQKERALKKVDDTTVENMTTSYRNHLNNNMNVTRSPIVRNDEQLTRAEGPRPPADTPAKKKGAKNKSSGKPFEYANGSDEWVIETDPGCGQGRHFQVRSERKQRGGRRFYLSVDTDHPWIAKHFDSPFASDPRVMYSIYDNIVGDAYMELENPDPDTADQWVRAKAGFLRARATHTAAHDDRRVELVA